MRPPSAAGSCRGSARRAQTRRRPISASPTRASSTCPSQSMEKQYLPSPSPVGRDSIRVRLTPRTANWLRMSISAPGWSSRRNAITEVLSAPGRAPAAGQAGRPRRTWSPRRRCRARRRPARPARNARPRSPGQRGVQLRRRRPAGPLRRSTRRAASRASGRCLASQRRHCGWACGWPPTGLMSASAVPGRASSANVDGERHLGVDHQLRPVASSSRVAVTAPSTEFSIGTTAPLGRAAAHRVERGLDRRAGQRLGPAAASARAAPPR